MKWILYKIIYIDFVGANRQFEWIEICLAFDKSDKHSTIYDCYNHEQTAKRIKLVKLSNYTEICSLKNEKNTTTTI